MGIAPTARAGRVPLLVAFLTVLGLAAGAGYAADLPLTLENHAGQPITTTYAAPLGAQLYSGFTLEHDSLAAGMGQAVTVPNVTGCSFNVMVVFADGAVIERRAIDLCSGTTLAVFDTDISIRP